MVVLYAALAVFAVVLLCGYLETCGHGVSEPAPRLVNGNGKE